MSDATTIGLSEAATRLGVPVRVLRHAIRSGALPGPAPLTATTAVSAEWVDSAKATIEAQPKVLSRASLQKVPPFARYRGTSAFRKYRSRVREYAQFLAETK
jgi:hypothetical protein